METYDGPDPLGYVVASNLHRRHLNESQRSMVAAKLATMKQGARTDLAQICAMSQQQAAEMLGVARRSVQSAAVVRSNGTPELVAAVEQGDIAVSVAADLAELPDEQQAQAVAQPDRAPHLAKKHKRQLREAALAEATERAEQQAASMRSNDLRACTWTAHLRCVPLCPSDASNGRTSSAVQGARSLSDRAAYRVP